MANLSIIEIAVWIVGGSIVAVLLWLMISVPAFIGKARKISQLHLRFTRIVSLCSFFFPIAALVGGVVLSAMLESDNAFLIILFFGAGIGLLLWLVAMCMAVMFPPETPAVPPAVPAQQVPSVVGKRTPKQSSNRTDRPAASAPQRTAVALAPATMEATDTCENCGRPIGRLETPNVWKDHVVCPQCYKTLSGS